MRNIILTLSIVICAIYLHGLCWAENQGHIDDIVLLRKAALEGDVSAQIKFAWNLVIERGALDDKVLARKWMRSAAEEGSCQACYVYALMLAQGDGGERDLKSAYKYLEQVKLGIADNKFLATIQKIQKELEKELQREDKLSRQRKDTVWRLFIFLSVVSLLVGGYLVFYNRNKKVLEFSPGDYADCFENSEGSCESECGRNVCAALPHWRGIAYRAAFLEEFAKEHTAILGDRVFNSRLPPFLRDLIYYLVGLDITLNDIGFFPMLDLGALPSSMNERCLQKIAKLMAEHARIPIGYFDVVYGGTCGGEAGHIEWMNGHARIVVGEEFMDRPYVSLKILAHELAHQFMKLVGVNHASENKNELLTDVTSLYLGFAKYVFEGVGVEGVGYYSGGRVGYLQQRELGYAYDFIQQLHGLSRDEVLNGLTKAGAAAVRESRWNRYSIPPPRETDLTVILSRLDAVEKRIANTVADNPCQDGLGEVLVAANMFMAEMRKEITSAPQKSHRALYVLWEDDLMIMENMLNAVDKIDLSNEAE